jgi:N utilization substance protein B
MLNRRHIRIKVLQALYAAIQSDNTDVTLGQKQLMQKLDKIYDLAIYQLSVSLEVRDYALYRIEEAKKKHLPTQEELNPNVRFVENSFLKKLEENIDYQNKAEKLAVNWVNESEMIRKMYLSFVETEAYQKYMSHTDVSFKADKDIVMALYHEVVFPNENLHAIFSEMNLSWSDDYNLSSEIVFMMISSYKAGWNENKPLPPLFKDDDKLVGSSQDRAFAKDLFRLVLVNRERFDELITSKIQNWEIERLATIDRILIQMALAEVLEMPTIPIKVSLNEYIELSKYFSTPKSKIFINGILDNLVVELKTQGLINKQGRGLMS